MQMLQILNEFAWLEQVGILQLNKQKNSVDLLYWNN